MIDSSIRPSRGSSRQKARRPVGALIAPSLAVAADTGHALFGQSHRRRPGRATDAWAANPLGSLLVIRLVGYTIGVAVIAALLSIPALFFGDGEPTANYEDTSISSYVADFTVQDDG